MFLERLQRKKLVNVGCFYKSKINFKNLFIRYLIIKKLQIFRVVKVVRENLDRLYFELYNYQRFIVFKIFIVFFLSGDFEKVFISCIYEKFSLFECSLFYFCYF